MKEEILELIKTRRSTRSFTEQQVEIEDINTLLEAGAWAPSGHNMQAWHFTVVQNKELINDMSDSTKEMLKDYPEETVRKMANSPDFNIFYNSPTVIVVSHLDKAVTPIEDISAATQNILLQGEAMGLGTCWNGFVFAIFRQNRKEEFSKKLEIPEGYSPYHAIALGYPKNKVVNAPERKASNFNIVK